MDAYWQVTDSNSKELNLVDFVKKVSQVLNKFFYERKGFKLHTCLVLAIVHTGKGAGGCQWWIILGERTFGSWFMFKKNEVDNNFIN